MGLRYDKFAKRWVEDTSNYTDATINGLTKATTPDWTQYKLDADFLYQVNEGDWRGSDGTVGLYDAFHKASWNFKPDAFLEDSKGSNDLTNVGADQYLVGAYGRQANFNGSSDEMHIADNTDLSPTSSFLVRAWANWDTIGAHGQIMAKTGSYELVYFNNSNRMFFRMYNGSGVGSQIGSGVGITAGKLTNVIAVADPTALKIYLYVDGVEAGTPAAYDGTIQDTSNPMYLGVLGGTNDWLNGKLSNVDVWNGLTFANDATREAMVADLQTSFYIG